jgi:signal transduction histidine kinase
MRLRPRYVTLLAVLVAGGLTDLVLLVPSLHFAYHSTRVHGMLETAAALIALLTAFLLWGRLQHRRRLADLLLFVGIGILAVTNLLFAAVPAVIWNQPHPFSIWTTLLASALGAAVLAAAANLGETRLTGYRRASTVALVSAAGLLVLVGIVVGFLAGRLPIGVDPATSPVHPNALLVGNEVIVITQMVIAVLLALAAIGFTLRAERHGDEFLLWLGAGFAVGALARVNYFIFPSLYSEWVYTGDALRLSFYALLLVGAAREISVNQHAYARASVLEERRRIARDLHDGVAQELAFIVAKSRQVEQGGTAPDEFVQIGSAAERGLDESRRAIAQLTQRLDEPFDLMLVQTVEDVGARLGTRVSVEAEPTSALAAADQEQLLRIVREALTNAVRHGRAESVHVRFSNGNGLRLHIADDGIGFDPGARDAKGFGLVVMDERARAIGGRMRIASTPKIGTTVEVIIP